MKSREQQPLNICFCGYIFIQRMSSVILGSLHILFYFFLVAESNLRERRKKNLPLNGDRCQIWWTLRFHNPTFQERGWADGNSQHWELSISTEALTTLPPTAPSSPPPRHHPSRLYLHNLPNAHLTVSSSYDLLSMKYQPDPVLNPRHLTKLFPHCLLKYRAVHVRTLTFCCPRSSTSALGICAPGSPSPHQCSFQGTGAPQIWVLIPV